MIRLAEYREKPDRLSDILTWAALVAPGVILNKDGSFQKTYRFRGPDLASATEVELLATTSRINNIFKRIPGGWVIFSESQRVHSGTYPESSFSDTISLMIDVERKLYFSGENHYENINYLTILYLPPPDRVGQFKDWLIQTPDPDQDIELNQDLINKNDQRKNQYKNVSYWTHLKHFQTEVLRIYSLFSELMPEFEPLTSEETLTYLHACISTKRHTVKVPEIPAYLDAILADSALTAGFKPKLGKCHLRTVSIHGFPGSTTPGILDSLNWLNFEYRWSTRFIPLDKIDAQKELKRYRKNWFASREGAFQMVKEHFSGPSQLKDNSAVTKSNDSDEALQELDADYVNYGYFTATVTVWDNDLATVEKKVNAVEKTINSLGFTATVEEVNAVSAWLSSLPGQARANQRRPLMNSLNLAHLFPLSAIWAGPEKNKHLNAPVLMYTQTPGDTPFRFSTHVGDVGHTMIVGPTGMGKSTFLELMAAQFRRYKDAQVYIFDKDESSKALTAGVGGDFYALAEEKEGSLSFQPLANIDNENECAWAAEWIYDFLRQENITIDPQVKKKVWTALESLAQAPKHQRTLKGFSYLLMDNDLKAALEPITNGAFSRLFNAQEDHLNYGNWQSFEMGKLMNTTAAIGPTLSYLFHIIEKRFIGVPTLLIIDEGWQFLKNSSFAAKIDEWLLVLRKANVSVIFATQSLSQINKSPLAQTIMEACQTKIYLPNPNALSKEIAPIYESFGINETERQIIAEATPKKQYYYKSSLGSRLFELSLGPIALAYCGASSKKDRLMVDQILSTSDKKNFNEEWLRYKGMPETAVSYHEFEESLRQVAVV